MTRRYMEFSTPGRPWKRGHMDPIVRLDLTDEQLRHQWLAAYPRWDWRVVHDTTPRQYGPGILDFVEVGR